MCLFVSISSIVLCADYGPYVAFNTNVLAYKSDYQYENIDLSPLGSLSLGCYYKSNKFKVFEFMSMLDYSMLRDKYNSLPITSGLGDNTSKVNGINNNHLLTLSGLVNYRIGEILYLGSGISASLLLASRTKVDEFSTEEYYGNYPSGEHNDGKTYKSSFYSPLSLSVPVIVGFEMNKFDLFLKLNFGITNRLKKETYIREYNNIFLLGLTYSIKM